MWNIVVVVFVCSFYIRSFSTSVRPWASTQLFMNASFFVLNCKTKISFNEFELRIIHVHRFGWQFCEWFSIRSRFVMFHWILKFCFLVNERQFFSFIFRKFLFNHCLPCNTSKLLRYIIQTIWFKMLGHMQTYRRTIPTTEKQKSFLYIFSSSL